MAKLALGFDYGTNSVRALLVDCATGEELATAVYEYPSGEHGVILDSKDPNLARQNPQDYLDGFCATAKEVLKGVSPEDIVGIGFDTTGSSPLPIDKEGRALYNLPEFAGNPNAACWLWKDHTSFAEAAEITEKARQMGMPYLAKCGDAYSSEWFWSKILHCARVDEDVFEAAYSWAEICDWIPATICGTAAPEKMVRSICAAGHKAMYHEDWDGLPSGEFLSELDPRLAALRERLYEKAVPSDNLAGTLSAEWAEKTGLKEGTPVAVGAFDAHFGAVASGAKKGTLVKIVGTSTCDCMVHPLSEPLADIPGVCGIVPHSVLPGYYGIEAGQSAVGDLFNWVTNLTQVSHEELTEKAAKLKPGESGLLALDWNNGNRTILVDPLLTGLLVGQTLHTSPAEVYRAVIEATAFGAKVIVNRLEEYGVEVKEVVCCGGIAEKSPLVMQIYADILNKPIKISRSALTCALGGAIFGSVVGKAHASVDEAVAKMTGTKPEIFEPKPENVRIYRELQVLYQTLHDAFGAVKQSENLGNIMKHLIMIRDKVRHG